MADTQSSNTSLFSGGSPDPNAGATGSWNTSQGQNQNTSTIDPNTMAALSQLLSNVQQNNQPAMSLNNGAIGNSQGQQLPPQAQKAAQKALQQYYDNHAQQVLNHPDGIQALTAAANGQNNPPTQGQGNSQVNPMQVLQSLVGNKQGQPLGTNQVNNPGILSPQNAFQNTSYNPQTGQVQQGGWVNRGVRGLASGGIPGLLQGLLGPSLQSQMGTTKEAQVLRAGQPGEIAEPIARAANIRANTEMQNLQNSGNEPIQPKDYMSAYSGMYQKALDSYSKVADSTEGIAKISQDLFTKAADDTRHAVQKAFGRQSVESAAAFQSAVASQKAALDASMDFHNFLFKNNPSQVMNQISQKVSNSTGGGIKVGDKFNGETVVNVKRIK